VWQTSPIAVAITKVTGQLPTESQIRTIAQALEQQVPRSDKDFGEGPGSG
jgi:hypothetical protein